MNRKLIDEYDSGRTHTHTHASYTKSNRFSMLPCKHLLYVLDYIMRNYFDLMLRKEYFEQTIHTQSIALQGIVQSLKNQLKKKEKDL